MQINNSIAVNNMKKKRNLDTADPPPEDTSSDNHTDEPVEASSSQQQKGAKTGIKPRRSTRAKSQKSSETDHDEIPAQRRGANSKDRDPGGDGNPKQKAGKSSNNPVQKRGKKRKAPDADESEDDGVPPEPHPKKKKKKDQSNECTNYDGKKVENGGYTELEEEYTARYCQQKLGPIRKEEFVQETHPDVLMAISGLCNDGGKKHKLSGLYSFINKHRYKRKNLMEKKFKYIDSVETIQMLEIKALKRKIGKMSNTIHKMSKVIQEQSTSLNNLSVRNAELEIRLIDPKDIGKPNDIGKVSLIQPVISLEKIRISDEEKLQLLCDDEENEEKQEENLADNEEVSNDEAINVSDDDNKEDEDNNSEDDNKVDESSDHENAVDAYSDHENTADEDNNISRANVSFSDNEDDDNNNPKIRKVYPSIDELLKSLENKEPDSEEPVAKKKPVNEKSQNLLSKDSGPSVDDSFGGYDGSFVVAEEPNPSLGSSSIVNSEEPVAKKKPVNEKSQNLLSKDSGPSVDDSFGGYDGSFVVDEEPNPSLGSSSIVNTDTSSPEKRTDPHQQASEHQPSPTEDDSLHLELSDSDCTLDPPVAEKSPSVSSKISEDNISKTATSPSQASEHQHSPTDDFCLELSATDCSFDNTEKSPSVSPKHPKQKSSPDKSKTTKQKADKVKTKQLPSKATSKPKPTTSSKVLPSSSPSNKATNTTRKTSVKSKVKDDKLVVDLFRKRKAAAAQKQKEKNEEKKKTEVVPEVKEKDKDKSKPKFTIPKKKPQTPKTPEAGASTPAQPQTTKKGHKLITFDLFDDGPSTSSGTQKKPKTTDKPGRNQEKPKSRTQPLVEENSETSKPSYSQGHYNQIKESRRQQRKAAEQSSREKKMKEAEAALQAEAETEAALKAAEVTPVSLPNMLKMMITETCVFCYLPLDSCECPERPLEDANVEEE